MLWQTIIIIIHIKRNFNKNKNERIYALIDINPDINQLFIDDLNGNNRINLNYLLTRDIKEILEEKKEELKLDEEFNKTLINYIIEELVKSTLNNDIRRLYINEIRNYIYEEKLNKNKIFEITYKLIEEDETYSKDIIEEIYSNDYINPFTIDIVSCLIESIKEKVFNKYLKKALELEDNNFFPNLLEIAKNKHQKINKDLVEDIMKKYLNKINIEKNIANKDPDRVKDFTEVKDDEPI